MALLDSCVTKKQLLLSGFPTQICGSMRRQTPQSHRILYRDLRDAVLPYSFRRSSSEALRFQKDPMGNIVRCAALTAKDLDDSWGPNWKQARIMLKKMEKEYGIIN
jgi:hypothetical protein